jgi:hypothetical protein
MPYGRPGAFPRLLDQALLWPVGRTRAGVMAPSAAVSRGQVIFGVRGPLTSAPDAEAVDVAAVTGMAAHGADKRSPNLRSRA